VKTCNRCGVEKEAKEGFYNKDNTCKECRRKLVLAYRWNNIEKYRAYDRERGNRLPKEYSHEYRAKHPKRYAATQAVARAIRSGVLIVGPCEVCNTLDNIHGHHKDYSKPLDVTWLCAAHHQQWHVENGEGLNG